MFFRLLRTDLKRGIFNWATLLVPVIMLIVSIAAQWENLISGNFSGLRYLAFAKQYSSMTWIFPVLCVIPYAVSYSDEYNTGYRNFILTKAGYKRYAWSKMLSVSISGAVVFIIWEVLLYAFCMLFNNPALNDYAYYDLQIAPRAIPLIQNAYALPYLAGSILASSLAAAAWASVGLALSAYIPNRYVVLAGPFVIMYLFIYVRQMFPILWGAYALDPTFHINFFFWIRYDQPFILIQVLAIWTLSSILFYTKAKEVLRNA